jgi:hypothetical protein
MKFIKEFGGYFKKCLWTNGQCFWLTLSLPNKPFNAERLIKSSRSEPFKIKIPSKNMLEKSKLFIKFINYVW